MKKIFFIFAMLSMAVISALAEESTEMFITIDGTYYEDANFTIEGTAGDGDGLHIHNGNTITIKSKNGEKITRVLYSIGYGAYGVGEYGREITPDYGTVNYSDCTINDVNATTLVISSNTSNCLEIDEITVFYELGNAGNNSPSVPDDYVLTESFANGGDYLGDNVKVEGNNSLYIGNGNTISVSPNNDKDVRIFNVDIEFSSEFSGTINSLDGSIVEGSGTNWTISNFYSPSLEISSSNGSGQISNITVYYVKMSEEETNVTFTTTTGKTYIDSEGLINVTGTVCTAGFGLDIDGGESVTITSYNGAEISKVELHLCYHEGPDIESTVGKITGKNKDWTISDINSSSLTISYPKDYETYEFIQIDEITVYYKKPEINSEMVVAASPAELSYWTTFYSNACNYKAPEGTEVYKVNLSGTKVTMTKIDDGIVNRCQGVVLKSTTPNITMTKTDDKSSDDYYGNSLWGTSSRITNPYPGDVYVLGNKESAGVAFYKLKSTGTIKANKAYLKVNSAKAREFFTFDFDATSTDVDNNATGVDSINTQDSEENVDVKIYDLQGRRVANPGKGIYIVNGKKVLMK
ncbi:MAG: hypothetical protein J5735_07220 [Prevotella sp.]|nr:hypothetical protein [Prevotella sp.]